MKNKQNKEKDVFANYVCDGQLVFFNNKMEIFEEKYVQNRKIIEKLKN